MCYAGTTKIILLLESILALLVGNVHFGRYQIEAEFDGCNIDSIALKFWGAFQNRWWTLKI